MDYNEPIYKPKEVAEILGMSRAEVYNLIGLGKLRAVKYGSHWRIYKKDLDKHQLKFESIKH